MASLPEMTCISVLVLKGDQTGVKQIWDGQLSPK